MTRVDAAPRPSLVAQALAADRLGLWPIVAIVGGAIAPLTVVAGGATTGWAVAGFVAIPLAYLVVAILLVVFASGYTAMSRGSVSAGPFYTFTVRGLGRPLGVGGGAIAAVAYPMMEAGLYGGLGAIAGPDMADWLGWSAPWWVWASTACAVIAVLGVLNVDWVGKVLAVLLAAEVLVTLVYTVVMFAHPAHPAALASGGGVAWSALAPGKTLAAGFGAACAIAIAGYVGFEGTGNLSEESKNPRRIIPLATVLAVVIPAVFYAAASLAMVTAAGPANIIKRAGSDGSETMFNLAAPYVPHALITVGHVLFLTSLFAGALGFHTVSSRYLFTFGREHVAPAVLGRTAVKSSAPWAASVLLSVVGFGAITLYTVTGWDPMTKMFFQLTVVAGFGVLLLMILSSAATASFFARLRNRTRGIGLVRGVVAPAISVLLLGVVAVETVQQFPTLIGVTPDDPLRWIFPGIFAAALACGLLWAGWLRTTRPHVYRAIGGGKPPQPAAGATGEPVLNTAGR